MNPTVFILSKDGRDLESFGRLLKNPIPQTFINYAHGRPLKIAPGDVAERIVVRVKFMGIAHDLHWEDITFDPQGNALLACAFEQSGLEGALSFLRRNLGNLPEGSYLLAFPPNSGR